MGRKQQQSGAAVYYRYEDATGRLHLVDSLESVPQALRPQAQRVVYAGQPTTVSSLLARASGGLSSWEMFGLGFAAALLILFLFRRMPGTSRLVLRLAMVGGVVALMAGAYLGWMRRATQQSGDAFASPTAIIDDAKDAVAKMNARTQADEQALKEIEQAK